jgi:hypothetical protein
MTDTSIIGDCSAVTASIITHNITWELDTIDAYWIQYWHYSIVIFFFFKINHSWDFNISDRRIGTNDVTKNDRAADTSGVLCVDRQVMQGGVSSTRLPWNVFNSKSHEDPLQGQTH